jgi:hypothetical protein
MGVDLLVLGFAPMDGFHGEGMAQDKGNPLLGTQVSKPLPREDAFDADHQPLSIGRNRLEKRFRRCLHIPVQHDLAVLIQEAEIHGSCMQVDATIKLVWRSVESPEVSSS